MPDWTFLRSVFNLEIDNSDYNDADIARFWGGLYYFMTGRIRSIFDNATPENVTAKLTDCHSRLLAARAERIRPGIDDKVLTAWNGLMLASLAEAALVINVIASPP